MPLSSGHTVPRVSISAHAVTADAHHFLDSASTVLLYILLLLQSVAVQSEHGTMG